MWWILWIFLLVILSVIGTLYFYTLKDSRYFTSRGVDYLGNTTYKLVFGVLKGISVADNAILTYKSGTQKNPEKKFFGMTDFGQIGVMITDLDLIKQILIKDFDHFVDRRQLKMPKQANLMAKTLIFINGDRWKSLRAKMSPTFTTGKIRRMFKIFDQSSKKLVSYIEKEMDKSGEVNLQEGYSKYTMDVIASAAFGIDSKTFDKKEASVFEKMAEQLQFRFTILLFIILPKLTDYLGLTPFSGDVMGFFSGAIKSAINHRVETGERRDDFIQLMMEAREGKSKLDESELNDFEKEAIIKTTPTDRTTTFSAKLPLEDDDIAAQCVIFIIGGFDTTQSLLIFMAYVLALHKDVQDKLRKEVLAALDENDGDLTYDSVNKMEYMEMIINGTF